MSEQEFDKEKFEEAFKKSWDEKHQEFDKISREKLIISLLGGVNVGKSTTINALTEKKYAEVKAQPGWTTNVTLYKLKKGVFIADTPGLNDINEDISEKATEYIEESSDLILFFVNATVGATIHDKRTFQEIERLNKSIIVVLNRIDDLDSNEIEDVLKHAEEKLGITPTPISAKEKIGINKLHEEIIKILEEKGKELLFLKVSRYKEKTVNKWINSAATVAAGIGAIPIPGADIVPLTTLQVGLAMKIAYIYDIKPSRKDAMNLLASTVTGTVGKNVARWAMEALRAAGWIGGPLLEAAVCTIAATVAASLTYGFGWACNAYYKSGMTLELGEVEDIFNRAYHEYKKKSDENEL